MSPELALDQVRKCCLAFDGAYEKLSHGSPCFFVEKGKQFVAFVDNHHNDGRLAVWVLCTLPVQESLVEENPSAYFRPPYVGGKGWVGICLDKGLDWGEVEGLIENGYELARPKR